LPWHPIVEASSGNTGNAMSMVAAAKGYKMLVVMPAGMSKERAAISRAFGAEVMTVGDFHVNDALDLAKELGEQPGYFAPEQFENEWKIEENRSWLGPEILDQLPAGVRPEALVVGVGTGRTLIGVGQAFRQVNPKAHLVAVEPDESCTLMCGEVGRHLIEGISDGFVPGIVDRHRDLVVDVVAVPSWQAIAEMRRLARQYGLFVGPSSGAHLIAARKYQASHPQLEHVVTVLWTPARSTSASTSSSSKPGGVRRLIGKRSWRTPLAGDEDSRGNHQPACNLQGTELLREDENGEERRQDGLQIRVARGMRGANALD